MTTSPFIIVSCLLAIGVFNACSLRIQQAEFASPDRLLAYQEETDKTTAKIEVIRDTGLIGSDCYMGVFVNRNLAARLATGERARFAVEPGTVMVRGGQDPKNKAMCGMEPGKEMTLETTIGPNETKFFRLYVSALGVMGISPIHTPN